MTEESRVCNTGSRKFPSWVSLSQHPTSVAPTCEDVPGTTGGGTFTVERGGHSSVCGVSTETSSPDLSRWGGVGKHRVLTGRPSFRLRPLESTRTDTKKRSTPCIGQVHPPADREHPVKDPRLGTHSCVRLLYLHPSNLLPVPRSSLVVGPMGAPALLSSVSSPQEECTPTLDNCKVQDVHRPREVLSDIDTGGHQEPQAPRSPKVKCRESSVRAESP